MPQTIEQALAAAKLYSDGQQYVLARLPLAAITAAAGVIAEMSEPFCALIVDKDEVTLLLPEVALADFARRLPGHTASPDKLRLITFDVVLEPTLVGFMARVTAALAAANVTVFPYAAFSRDHLFVPTTQYDSAIAALKKLGAR
ncbi:MAG: ACT domain-containing protein [Burkholderiales bacterium]|nr:ACT domain-containing protein [Anaerolineae bacterium]